LYRIISNFFTKLFEIKEKKNMFIFYNLMVNNCSYLYVIFTSDLKLKFLGIFAQYSILKLFKLGNSYKASIL